MFDKDKKEDIFRSNNPIFIAVKCISLKLVLKAKHDAGFSWSQLTKNNWHN